jgi:hypothetical protein
MDGMKIGGFGMDVNIGENQEAFFTTAGDASDVLISGLEVTGTSATEVLLNLRTAGLVHGDTYDLYLDDGNLDGDLCEPVSFDVAYMWPDTGQTDQQCSNGSTPGVVPCASIVPGSAFYGQDGHYNDPRRQRNYTDNGDGTIRDNVTGLTWQQAASATTMDWYAAMTYCPAGWRLPNIHELWTLVDAGRASPAIDPLFSGETSPFWSSTSELLEDSATKAWYVWMENGSSLPAIKTAGATLLVRCVQGDVFGHVGANSYETTDNTVHDRNTRLMWERNVRSAANFETSLAACEGATTGGYTDWRLPDRNELATLVDLSTHFPAFADNVFINNLNTYLISDSLNIGTVNNEVWAVLMNNNGGASLVGGQSPAQLICVRN